MRPYDQASELRVKVTNTPDGHEVDVMNLPPRSTKHNSPKGTNKKKTNQSRNVHLWITRSIVFFFICFLIFIFFYYSSRLGLDPTKQDDIGHLKKIIRSS